MNLQNKVALITGASRGIGFSFSEALIERGAIVYGMSRSQSKLDEAQSKLGEAFRPIAADVQDHASITAAVSQAHQEAGRIDILVNNAGVGSSAEIESVTDKQWEDQIGTNLTGVLNCTREVVPIMKAQNAASGFGGHIINVASIAGLMGNPKISVYNTTKFGLRGMSESLMKELRVDGIKVSCMYPGSIQTEFFQDFLGIEAHDKMMQPEDVAATLVHLLEGPDNYLVSEVVMRPLRPR